MKTRDITLFGVPCALRELKKAEWLGFEDDPAAFYFDGLEFHTGEYLCMEENATNPVPCRITVSSICENGSLKLHGFVSSRVASALMNGGTCILGHHKTVRCEDNERKFTGEMVIREPFTTSFDGERTVEYRFDFELG